MLIAVVSDTHLPRGRRAIPEAFVARMAAADLIVHAGDFTAAGVLDAFERMGPPLIAVHGNADEPAVVERLPATAEIRAEGRRIGVVHDAGPAKGRPARLRRRFPGCDAVVFGHSHIPLLEEQAGFQIFNPGSPTDRRRQPAFTMGLGHVTGGGVAFELLRAD